LHKRMIRVDFSKTKGPKPRTPGVYKGPAKWGGALAESHQKENLPVIPDYFHNTKKKSKPYRIEDEPDYEAEQNDSASESSDSSDSESSDTESDSSDGSDTMVQSESVSMRKHKHRNPELSSLKTFSTRDDNSTIGSTLVTPSYTATDGTESTIAPLKFKPDNDGDSSDGGSLGEEEDDYYRRSSSRRKSKSSSRRTGSSKIRGDTSASEISSHRSYDKKPYFGDPYRSKEYDRSYEKDYYGSRDSKSYYESRDRYDRDRYEKDRYDKDRYSSSRRDHYRERSRSPVRSSRYR